MEGNRHREMCDGVAVIDWGQTHGQQDCGTLAYFPLSAALPRHCSYQDLLGSKVTCHPVVQCAPIPACPIPDSWESPGYSRSLRSTRSRQCLPLRVREISRANTPNPDGNCALNRGWPGSAAAYFAKVVNHHSVVIAQLR